MSFRGFFLSLTIVAILMFSAFGTITPVFADDGTTTQVAESSTPAPAADEGTPAVTEVAPQPTDAATEEATPQPTDTATEEVAPQPTDAVTEEAAPQPTDVATEEVTPTAPVLEQLPENTTVTVVDSKGDAQPLVTQDSAEALASAYDPIWCPAGQSPTPGANGCTSSFSSFDALLTYLKANEGDVTYQQAGTIYIQNGQYLGGESKVDFNTYFNPGNTTSTSLNNYNLTLQGGWNTSDNTVTDTTKFNVPVIVGSSSNPWFGSLTFNNLVISGVSNQTGLTAYSQQNITLSNVEVTNSQAGANLDAGGNVRIDASKFNNNKKAGANIRSGKLTYITNSEFNGNESGVGINSNGGVSLDTVLGNNNGKYGADITAVGVVEVYDSIFSGNVFYTYNCKGKTATGGYGLKVVTAGFIDLEGVQANNNYVFGASLNGSSLEMYGGTSIANNTFDGNGYGLNVNVADYVTIFDTQANNNGKYGADIAAVNGVEIYNSVFSGNVSYTYSCKGKTATDGYGLNVVTTDYIYVEGIQADNNYLFGASLNGSSIEIHGGDAIATNTFNGNGYGLNAQASSYIKVYDAQANNNKQYGSYLEGTNVTVSQGVFNNNGYGLKVISHTDPEGANNGYATLLSVTANNNKTFGADVQANRFVTIRDSFFDGNKSYTCSCYGVKTYFGYGLKVVTNGNIEVTNTSASGNNLFGASLTSLNGGVNVDGGTFSDNGSEAGNTGKGLEVNSYTTTILANIHAENNQLFGADIQAKSYVTIRDSVFNGNVAYTYSCKGKSGIGGYGLNVVSGDEVDLTNVTASNNYSTGASLTSGNGQDVNIIKGFFNDNGSGSIDNPTGKGLEIVSAGEVALTSVQAKNNQLFGANIQAEGDVAIGSSDNSNIFSGNKSYTYSCKGGKTYQGYGLQVITKGNISLLGIQADNNYLYGAHLEGNLVNVSEGSFSGNGTGNQNEAIGKGLEIIASGTGENAVVSLYKVTANNNQLFGADIKAASTVSVTNSVFSGNVYYTSGTCKNKTYNGYGLKVVAPANSITVDNVTANDNGLFGATLEGSQVTVTNSTFNNNKASSGLIITGGDVTLDNVTATGNGADGVTICKADSVAATNSTFTDNKAYGLKVASPVFSESGNTYLNNGSGSLFYNSTTCTPASNNNGNNNNNNQHNKWWGNWWTNWWKGYGHNNWHGGFYGGKNCHSFGK